MGIDVELTTDPATALARAGDFLVTDPVRHNVILTLLHGRVARAVAGRYLVVSAAGHVAGVAFQSPLTFIATITPMTSDIVDACVDVFAGQPPALPGVSGEAGSAARFAGQWTERTKSAAVPRQGQRIYEARSIVEPAGVPGALRRAEDGDRALLVEWLRAFSADTGEPVDDAEETVQRRVAAGQFWLWQDGGPVSMAAVTSPVAGTVRVQAVYTPAARRNRGYAAASVARLSSLVLREGTRCILYTDLANPVSNSIYRRMGYRTVAEVLRYQFA